MQLNLSENIKKYRKEMNLTQEGLADAFGVTVGAVSKWESGSTIPDILTLVELADFFGISMDVLLGYSVSSKSVKDITKRLDDLLKENRYDEAISKADKALVRYPANFKITFECARTYHVVSAVGGFKNYKERTIELYETSLRYIDQNTDSDINEFFIRMAIAELKGQDNPEEALEEFNKINYMGIADINIAMILMNNGRVDEAMAKYTRVLVSILVRSLQFSSNMAIALAMSGKKKDIKEASEAIDWCIKIFDATSTGKQNYLHKMKVVLMIIKSMCLSYLKDYDNMRATIDEAYRLAQEFDSNPTNGIAGKIKFWHGSEDFRPNLYDELGPTAVGAIDALFAQKCDPIPREVFKKMDEARNYWKKIKNESTELGVNI